MSIIRTSKNNNPFVMLDKGFLEDTNLSWKAKGLLAYLLSRPDNWEVIVPNLIKQAKDGRDSVYSGLKELTEAKYIVKKRVRKEGENEKGRFDGWEYIVYETPQLNDSEDEENSEIASSTKNGKTVYGKSENGKTVYGKSDTTNININNINLTNNELIINANDDEKLAKIIRFYEENFGVVNPFIFEEIVYWLNDMNDELVEEAMKRALRQQKKWNYAVGILKDWANKKIQTLDDVKALDVEYANNMKSRSRSKRNSRLDISQGQQGDSLLEKLFTEHKKQEEKQKMSPEELEERHKKLLAKMGR